MLTCKQVYDKILEQLGLTFCSAGLDVVKVDKPAD